uniref:Uncharacterized protein n=1 Tax=Trichuris muris TaxID=70415 RepID=A0A5S6QZR9_TRIMR
MMRMATCSSMRPSLMKCSLSTSGRGLFVFRSYTSSIFSLWNGGNGTSARSVERFDAENAQTTTAHSLFITRSAAALVTFVGQTLAIVPLRSSLFQWSHIAKGAFAMHDKSALQRPHLLEWRDVGRPCAQRWATKRKGRARPSPHKAPVPRSSATENGSAPREARKEKRAHRSQGGADGWV